MLLPMRMFRHPEDKLPVLAIGALFAVDVAVYLLVDAPVLLFAWTLLGIIPKGCVCAWNHHHQHVPMFLKPVYNRAFELVLGLQTGITAHLWVLHHSLGHHVNYLDQHKDESRWQRRDGSVMGSFEYTLAVTFTSYWRAWVVGRRYPRARRVFAWMAVVSAAVFVALVAYRPLPGLLVFVLPAFISLVITSWATYTHHTENDTSSHFVASNNVIQRVYNLVTGNLGYHTAHHYKPGVHWSRLPRLHDDIAAKIPSSCYTSPGYPWRFFGAGWHPGDPTPVAEPTPLAATIASSDGGHWPEPDAA